MKTHLLKKNQVEHEWYIVDVAEKILGRAATEIATLLSGKYRSDYTPHVDSGAGVVVVNCDKVKITGKKAEQKVYKRFSGYPGGQKETVYKKMFAKDPKFVVKNAVKGMLPKSRLGARMLKRLKLYIGDTHPHIAQTPKEKKI